jgi:hypothetical protein
MATSHQHGGERGAGAGDRPRRALDAPVVDARQARRQRVLGERPHLHAERRAGEQQRQPDAGGDTEHDECEPLVRHDRTRDRHTVGEWQQAVPERARCPQGSPQQPDTALDDAGDAERHEQLDDLRRARDRRERDAMHDDAEYRAERDRDDERDADGQRRVPLEELEVHVRRRGAHGRVGEVEDAAGPVHEHDAHREEREHRADGEAEHGVLDERHRLLTCGARRTRAGPTSARTCRP